MKRINIFRKFRVIYSLFLVFVPSLLLSQPVKFKIENWEKRINNRQPPEVVLDEIGFDKGMMIGEIGAGTGRMTLWIADRIGPEGIIYANDIDAAGLNHLKVRAREAGFENIRIIVGEVTDPKLPDGVLDIVFMINVFHHLDDSVTLLKNTKSALKPGGFLAIVDCDPAKVEWGKSHGCTGKEEMREKLKLAGYELIKISDVLKEDGIYIAEPVR